jgi:hypothetical protein
LNGFNYLKASGRDTRKPFYKSPVEDLKGSQESPEGTGYVREKND